MMVRVRRGRGARFLGVSVLALCAAQIVAARAQDGSAVPLEEINVQGKGQGETAEGPVEGYVASRSASGTKTDTPIVETPQSISVVTRDEFTDRGATTLQDAISYTPGVASFSSGRSIALDEFLVRGFDTANGNLGQLRDGMKLQANLYDGSQELYGLERLEILKGPASILYGQLGPGGIVNSVTKRPSFTPIGEINLTGGSFDNKQLSADVSGPIGTSGDWAYRITGLVRDSNSWIDHVPDDRRYIAPAITWKPTDATSLTLLAYYQETRTRFTAPMDAEGTVFRNAGGRRVPRDFFIGDTDFDRYNINSGALSYIFDHAFNENVSFSSRGRYYESKADWDYLTFLRFAGPTTIARGRSARTEHSKVWTSDNHLQFKFDTGPVEHTAIVGVDYARQTYDTERYRDNFGGFADFDGPDSAPISGGYGANRGFDRKINQVGVYAQDQIKIADKFIFLAGGRQDWASTDLKYDTPAYGIYPKQKDHDFTAHLGAVYLAPYGFAPYVSYSESFSPAIVAEQTAGTGLRPSFKPTTGEQYEGGLRWTSPDQKTLLTASVFRIKQRNVVGLDSNYEYKQTGLVRSKGFEFEAKSRQGAWEFLASYAYTDAKTVEDEDTALIGQQLPTVPWHQAAVWAKYDLTSIGVPGLTLGAGLKYFGKTNIDEPKSVDPVNGKVLERYGNVPGYVTVDALARLDLGALNPKMQGFQAQLNAKNLLDKKTYSCVSAKAGCNYGQPRTILATLSYKW
ncbi:ferric siderophore receptor [Hansschlegelia plantiphila]|uniref:Ferric siderophore receptor n=2 Tax=Hansschlegelia plantiphila TaxID=374655 RepID=A0A9W6J5I3_9HYPH|nr:ferric siderophore receptor [Hansschlegelia plantiphila]